MSEFPALRAALLAAAERQQHRTTTAPGLPATVRRNRRAGAMWWRLQLRTVVVVVVSMLVLAAVALAAAGVFSAGRPVEPVRAANPRTFDGAVIPSTIRLLALGTSDPGGGPTWGLRVARTTRGEICVVPGRVQGGVIGVLGVDGAFGNDQRLHPFSSEFLDQLGCALPDADSHAFLSIGQIGLPSSALGPGVARGDGGCLVANPLPRNRALLCSRSELRDVYFGLLGPDAVSVSYRSVTGQIVTEATGADGAYLVVLPYTTGLQGNAMIGTALSGAPFINVRYRDGRTCSTAHGRACAPVGFVRPYAGHLTESRVRAPIVVRVIRARSYCNSRTSGTVIPCNGRVPAGFNRMTAGTPFVLVDITFVARQLVSSSHAYYEVDTTYPKTKGCTVGGTEAPTNADIHSGQLVHSQDYVPVNCPGVLRGAVYYVRASTLAPPFVPGATAARSLLVGRFSINLTNPH